jgi:hypothetical protein
MEHAMTNPRRTDPHEADTPTPVITSIAAGVAPLPFLLVYSVIFIAHGYFWPVDPPDITTTRRGEGVAGLLAVLIALVIVLTLWWFLSTRRRWPHLLVQLAVLAVTIGFVAMPRTGSPTVPIALIVTSAVSLGFGLHAASARYVGSRARILRGSRALRSGRGRVVAAPSAGAGSASADEPVGAASA